MAKTSFKGNVLYRLQTIIVLTMQRQNPSTIARDLLSMVREYMSKELQEYYEDGPGSGWSGATHHIRTSMLALWDCDALPYGKVDFKERKHSDVLGGDSKSVTADMDLRMIMMFYLEKRNQVNRYAPRPDYKRPMDRMHNLLNVGWTILSPYLSEEDAEEWEKAVNVSQDEGLREGMYKKMDLTSKVMDRESLQWGEADVDEVEFVMPSKEFEEITKEVAEQKRERFYEKLHSGENEEDE